MQRILAALLPWLARRTPEAAAPSAQRGRDLRIAIAGLAAALASLPLPAHASSPEAAAALAVGAIALATGHRWGLAIVVLAEVLLVAALWPAAFLHQPPSVPAQVAVAIAFAGALPGVLAIGRAAPSLLDLFGIRGSPQTHRLTHGAMVLAAVAVLLAPAI
jgi:hypothetical protein